MSEVCGKCKEDLRTNPMYKELGMVLICNHKGVKK